MANKNNWWKKLSTYKGYITYGGILLFFIIWMLFIDTHSWNIHQELNKEIEQLELEKKALQKIIQEDKATIEQLNNIDSLERFARENYGHKKENETVFIIEIEDSLAIN